RTWSVREPVPGSVPGTGSPAGTWLEGPPGHPRISRRAGGDHELSARGRGVARVSQAQPRYRVDQGDSQPRGHQAPLLCLSAVAGKQVDRAAARLVPVLDVETLAVDAQGAIRLGRPGLGRGVVAGPDVDLGPVCGLIAADVKAHSGDLRHHRP